MRPIRRVALSAGYAALLLATAWLLYQFAQAQFTAHLRDQAAYALALAARGDTPYRWHFDNPDSIVAGRVFDAAEFRFEQGELRVRASGRPFDVGLTLARPVDLRLFPQLRIDADADGPTAVQIVVYDDFAASERVLTAQSIGPGLPALTLDLRAGQWMSGSAAAAAPAKAAVLRLRLQSAPSTTVRLRAAALLRNAAVAALDLSKEPQIFDSDEHVSATQTPVYRLPLRAATQEVDIATIAQKDTGANQLLILLPQHARVEQQIALRNNVFAALPGAILVPERALDDAFAQARGEPQDAVQPGMWRWYLLTLFGAALFWSYLRPPRHARLRAALEALLALAGPLWLIIADHFDGKPDAWQAILIAMSAGYAISLSLPKQWHWNGSASAWLWALAIVALAALAGLMLREDSEPLRTVGSAHLVRYLAWAFVQQYLVCAVCTERWRVACGNHALAAYLGAVGFALMHTPNAALMLATLLGGLCWCALYLRERALLPLAVSHAASALLLLALLPRSILASAEVSARFFQ
jgi:hypothetical protein